jgi:hypothetical protein
VSQEQLLGEEELGRRRLANQAAGHTFGNQLNWEKLLVQPQMQKWLSERGFGGVVTPQQFPIAERGRELGQQEKHQGAISTTAKSEQVINALQLYDTINQGGKMNPRVSAAFDQLFKNLGIEMPTTVGTGTNALPTVQTKVPYGGMKAFGGGAASAAAGAGVGTFLSRIAPAVPLLRRIPRVGSLIGGGLAALGAGAATDTAFDTVQAGIENPLSALLGLAVGGKVGAKFGGVKMPKGVGVPGTASSGVTPPPPPPEAPAAATPGSLFPSDLSKVVGATGNPPIPAPNFAPRQVAPAVAPPAAQPPVTPSYGGATPPVRKIPKVGPVGNAARPPAAQAQQAGLPWKPEWSGLPEEQVNAIVNQYAGDVKATEVALDRLTMLYQLYKSGAAGGSGLMPTASPRILAPNVLKQ